MRLPRFLRRREAEQRRVDAFLAAIHVSADEDDPAPARHAPTVALPLDLVRLMVRP